MKLFLNYGILKWVLTIKYHIRPSMADVTE